MKIDAKYVASISRVFCLIFAMSVILLGASVMYGWHAKLLFLIKYAGSPVAMGYNPALLFVLSGLSIILISFNKYKISFACGLFILFMGIATFMQYMFPIDLHIDEFFFKPWQTYNDHPGRMAPNSALCFTFVGCILLLINSKKIKITRMTIAITLSVLMLCLSVLFLSGYHSDMQNAYEWSTLAPMAENTAFGLVLVSISLVFFIIGKSVQEGIVITQFLPYVIVICLFVTILLLTFAIMHVQENMGASKIAWNVLIFGSIFAIIVGVLTKTLIKAFMAEKEVQGALSLVRATFEANVSGIVVISKSGKIVDNNKLFLKIWDISPAQIIDCNMDELRDIMLNRVKDKRRFELTFKDFEKELVVTDNEIELNNGNVILLNARLQILNNQPVGVIWSCQDITLRKNLEEELLRQATYDTLTGLPNKFLIIDMLARALEVAKLNKTKVAVIFLDLDGFSKINDLFGRSRGDFLLQAISERLRSVLLEDEMLGRIAGDEFLVIIPDIKDNAEVLAAIYRLQGTFHNPFSLHGSNISVTMCAGIALSPKDGIDADTILSNADIAVLKSKQEGRNRFKFYHESMNVYSIRNIELEHDLHAALEKDQFVVHYQPIINLANNKPYAVEALIRWNHPLQKIIPPLDFIPLAENLGLINKIGEWVLITACAQLEQWQQAGCNDLHLTVNVNVSANQFKLGFILHSVQEAINNTKVDPRYLNLELTEDVLFAGGEDMDEVLIQLRNMGVSISIDDFGIGYSSFAYLRKLKVNTLKIDKSFISHLGDNREEEAIVSAIIAMGRNLQIKVLAEGVETPEQLEILRAHGCNLAQGFLFAKPMPAQECWAYLQRYID